MSTGPIGVFDSGAGGLAILWELQRRLPAGAAVQQVARVLRAEGLLTPPGRQGSIEYRSSAGVAAMQRTVALLREGEAAWV